MNIRFAALVGLAIGCTPSVPEAEDVDVAECAGDADVDDTIRIAEEFEDSAHEMIQCGSLTSQFIVAVIATARHWIGEPTSGVSAFSYANGLYTTNGDGVRMDLALADGAAPLLADVFDPNTFLAGSNVEASGGTATVTFNGAGPLVALLGKGAAPTSPLTFTAADIDTIGANLSALLLDSLIAVDDPVDTSVVTYDITGDPVTLGAFVVSRTLNMAADQGSATRTDLGQTLTTTVWDVEFLDGPTKVLIGAIEANVTGGPFPFHVKYDYDGVNAYPYTTITCE